MAILHRRACSSSPAKVLVILPSNPTARAIFLNSPLCPQVTPAQRWTFSCTRVSSTLTGWSSSGQMKISVVWSAELLGDQHCPATPFFFPAPPGHEHDTRHGVSGQSDSAAYFLLRYGEKMSRSIITTASVNHSSRVLVRSDILQF